jgi:hypothetical protein
MANEATYVTPVSSQGLVLYSGPGNQYGAVTSVFIGDALQVVEDPTSALAKVGNSGQWIQVQTLRGESGWIAAGSVQRAYIERPGAAPVSTPSPQPAPTQPKPIVPPAPGPAAQPLYLYSTYLSGI